jgi:hypothetical protein
MGTAVSCDAWVPRHEHTAFRASDSNDNGTTKTLEGSRGTSQGRERLISRTSERWGPILLRSTKASASESFWTSSKCCGRLPDSGYSADFFTLHIGVMQSGVSGLSILSFSFRDWILLVVVGGYVSSEANQCMYTFTGELAWAIVCYSGRIFVPTRV